MKNQYGALLICILCLIAVPSLEAAVQSSVDAQSHVLDVLLNGDFSGKRILSHPDLLAQGTPIETWHGTAVTTPAEGYVVFIDDMAFASFEHPCRYVFVDKATGSVEVTHAMTPPNEAMTWLEMEGEAKRKLMAAKNRRADRAEHPAPPGKSARGGELYAVLMNGGASQYSNHIRYWNDLSNIYITLVDVYGYKDQNIIVLCSDGLDPSPDQSDGTNSPPDLDGDGDDDIMYSCVKTNVNLVFGELASILDETDQLFVFTTDHGSSVSGWSVYLNLWNSESLNDYELADLYDALPACNIVTTMEQCFSGGFEDDLTGEGHVFSSAAAYNEYSWAMPPNYEYDTYVFFWTAAVKWEDAYGVPCDADLNGDELISMHEAFIYAEANDFSDETPQYDSTPVELGDEMTLFGTGETWYVPADFLTIQAAVDAAEDNDRILVSAGTYAEAVDFLGKAIIVESVDGPATTVIDGSGNPIVVTLGRKAKLIGFTVQGGTDSGVRCTSGNPVLERNRIMNNGTLGSAVLGGGVTCLMGTSPILINCYVCGNQAGQGGGLGVKGFSSMTLTNCTVLNNTASLAGGGFYINSASTATRATNCIFWGNTPDQIYDVLGASATVTYSNVEDGYSGTGNIDEDPLFAGIDGELSKDSCCINMGDDASIEEDLDLYGNVRVCNGCVDMGACEALDVTLAVDAFTLVPKLPGQLNFTIDFGPTYAGRDYIVLGSATGRTPGITLNNTMIPLNWDYYSRMVYKNLNTSVYFNFLGTLDGNGRAAPVFNYPGNGDSMWIGYVFHHAAITLNPIDMSSNPVPVTFVEE